MSAHKTREELRKFIQEMPSDELLDEDLTRAYDDEYAENEVDVYEHQDKDAEDIIAILSNEEFKESNIDQSKALQILRFLAESDEDAANDFMKRLSDKFTEISKDMGVTK